MFSVISRLVWLKLKASCLSAHLPVHICLSVCFVAFAVTWELLHGITLSACALLVAASGCCATKLSSTLISLTMLLFWLIVTGMAVAHTVIHATVAQSSLYCGL